MNPTRSVCFQAAVQGSPPHPRAGGCSFSSFLPGAGVGRGGICFPSLWILLFEKQASNCLREDGSHLHTRLQDGWSGGKGYLSSQRGSDPTQPVWPCVQVQTQPSHFLEAEQPQASGFPIRDLGFSTLEWRGFICWAGLQWTQDRGEGHVSCSFQLRLCGHELVSETVPRLG